MKVKISNYTIRGSLAWANEYFKHLGIVCYKTDSELLLSDILKISRNELYINLDRELIKEDLCRYVDLVEKRGKRYPLDYILGYSIFMGLKLEVNSATLIPRPETELLVETLLEFIEKEKQTKVLEIGSGSGNIAVSLAKFSDCEIVSVEKSSEALAVAQRNADKHGVSDRIKFMEGDMFNSLNNEFNNRFDYLISNPPYVKVSEYATIQEEVKREPKSALVAGKDGLKYIGIILKDVRRYVRNGGLICMEIGYNQKNEVENLIKNNGYKEYRFIKDYNKIDRIILIWVNAPC